VLTLGGQSLGLARDRIPACPVKDEADVLSGATDHFGNGVDGQATVE